VVYEHFGGKEGLYAVVVDREMRQLLDTVTGALTAGHPRILLEQAALALLTYIETQTDGFRILVRDSPVTSATGNFSSLIGDIASQVRVHPGGQVQGPVVRREARQPVFAGAGGNGRADRAVVVGSAASRRRKKWPRSWSTWPGTGCPTWRRNHACEAVGKSFLAAKLLPVFGGGRIPLSMHTSGMRR